MKTIACALFLFCLFLLPNAILHAGAPDRSRENPTDANEFSLERRLVFYAVLEGLYEDGVAGEALDLLIPDARGMWIEGQPEKTNFVYACPLCTPAFDALRLYKARLPFYGQKATKYTTFGPGLPDEMLVRLKGAPQERRDVIQELIRKWVKRRLEMMALPAAERAAVEENLEEMKEQGEALLKSFQENGHGDAFSRQYTNWEKCSVCEGTVGAMGSGGAGE